MTRTIPVEEDHAQADSNIGDTKDLESTSKLTISTAPLTPPVHDATKNEYDKGVPTSASTLSSATSLEMNQNHGRVNSPPPPPSSCSSPYDAFLLPASEWLGSRELQLQLPDMLSRSSSRGGGGPDEETESVASGAYFDPVDLDSSNWMKAIRMDGPTFGFAMVALATALVHPWLFVVGAVTAFGTLHAVDYCSKQGGTGASEETAASWENSMLSICLKEAPQESLPDEEEEVEGAEEDEAEEAPQSAQQANNSLFLPGTPAIEGSTAETGTTSKDSKNEVADTVVVLAQERDAEPEKATNAKGSRKTELLSKELVEQTYPPLDNKVVNDVSFPGLHAIEFFRVFFADDAPYNFMELQKQRGDLDIVYGKWQELSPHQPISLHKHKSKGKPKSAKLDPSPLQGWKSSFQGRVLNFRAKTNNFIGPVYATTQKTQRVLLHHKTMIVMESRTDLSDIPFADRFYVLERWIVRAEKVRDETLFGKSKYKYVSTLNATSQVVFTQSCQFASQIKSKSASTIQDLVKCWCTMAKEALKLTEQRKILRLKHEQEGESEADYCDETDLEEEHADPNHQSKENTPPTHHEEEGIEVTWPEKQAPKKSEIAVVVSRPKLRHSGSAPLPAYRGRALQSFRRSVSSLWNRR